MRTNIEIDDKLMEAAMAAGGFKTKREAVEAGLRMINRRKAYDALLDAFGTLHWDDSDQGWAAWRAQKALQVNEAVPVGYAAVAPGSLAKLRTARAAKSAPAKRGRTT